MTLVPGAGLFGLGAYAFSTIAPLWAFAFFGPLIRHYCPDGFTLAEFVRASSDRRTWLRSYATNKFTLTASIKTGP